MKKLLLSLAFATALSAPAFAQECCSVNSNVMLQQGINNGAIVNQLAAGDDLELDGDSLQSLNAASALDLSSLTIQNVTDIGGNGYVQNINAEVEEGANVINGDIAIALAIDNSTNVGGDQVAGDLIEGDVVGGDNVGGDLLDIAVDIETINVGVPL